MKSGMEEAIRRMESGEDPEKIEQEMGDVFEEDPFGGESPAGTGDDLPGGRPGRKSLRRILPPAVDPVLYEM